MNCPICSAPMIRGGVTIKNSAWRLGASSLTGDILYFVRLPDQQEAEIMRNGWMRDAFHCETCVATLMFDGRKTPVE